MLVFLFYFLFTFSLLYCCYWNYLMYKCYPSLFKKNYHLIFCIMFITICPIINSCLAGILLFTHIKFYKNR